MRILMIILCILLVSCQKEEIPVPETLTNCSVEFTGHPKNHDYQEILDGFTKNGITGINLLVDNPEDGMWAGASGYADIKEDVKMTPCHLGYSASIIKTYISVIILQLAEEGQLSLDDRLTSYISNDVLDKVPNGNEVTIRHLLQNRSGIPDVFEARFLLDFLNNPGRSYRMEDLISYVYDVKPVAKPGVKFYYSDANFILLSMIIERLDGDLKKSFRNRIFEVLGTSQSYLIDSPEQLPDGVSASYWDRYGNSIIEDISDIQIALIAGLEGTDGLITSISDMNLFLRSVVDGKLISTESYTQMTDFIDIPEGESNENYSGYGLGIARVKMTDEVWYGSFGNQAGSAKIMLYNPAHNTTIVISQNTGTFFNDDIKIKFFGELIVQLEQIVFK